MSAPPSRLFNWRTEILGFPLWAWAAAAALFSLPVLALIEVTK